jgi:hypothetical protein
MLARFRAQALFAQAAAQTMAAATALRLQKKAEPLEVLRPRVLLTIRIFYLSWRNLRPDLF